MRRYLVFVAKMYFLLMVTFSLLYIGINSFGGPQDLTPYVNFRFYNGETFSNYVDVSANNPELLLNTPGFSSKLSTVFYVHGYVEQPADPTQEAVVTSHLKRKDTNIILVDWSKVDGGNYFLNAVPNVKKVGNVLAKSIKNLVDHGLNIKTVNIVGHSLGAQVSSQAGARLKDHYSITVNRIIGLDPSLPGFYFTPLNYLKRGDADFVLCLHTDLGIYGTPFSTCDADFWANSGRRIQPGCPKNVIPLQQTPEEFCSHKRSVQLYSEAVVNNKAFIGHKCLNYVLYKTGLCKGGSVEEFSPFTSVNATGNYYFSTNGEPPFGSVQLIEDNEKDEQMNQVVQ